MKLRYDLDLVEGIISLCAAGKRQGISSLQIVRYQFERERLYSILDGDERDAAFSTLHLKWFREWGFERFLERLLSEFPSFSNALEVLVFRKVRTKNEELAELYIDPSGIRNGVVALRSQQFENDDPLKQFLRHELMHVSDMICPEFGYSGEPLARNQSPSQQRLTQDRYRLLWAISIDGRLTRSGRETVASREHRWTEFERAYSFWPEKKRNNTFESLWKDSSPKHARLMELATDPREIQSHPEPFPGGLCPLCSFSTFEWATAARFTPTVSAAILKHFPKWEPSSGACNRCTEIYELSRMEYPATLRT